MDCPFRMKRIVSFSKRWLSVSSVDIVEQTDVHEPWHYHSDSPISGDYYGSPPYSVCSSPPTGYQNWVVCQLNVPIQTFSFHNTSYVITANYHYIVFTGAYPPSPSNQMYSRVDGSISITVNFQNLIVEAQPKILKWDPDVPQNRDTTFSYTLSSAQKKNCQVKIQIYNMEGNVVYETTLTQLCPGSYTFTWDGTNNQLPPPAPSNIAPAGLYTFDIQVQGACPYDQDSFRSGIIKVTQTSLDVEESKYKFGYYIESTNGTLPSEVKVTVYGPAIDNFKVYWGPNDGSKNLGWNYVYFPQDAMKVGGDTSYVVVSGKDSDVVNKAHKFKPFLEHNQNPKLATAALFYATYYWKDGGKDDKGNIIWIPVYDETMKQISEACVNPAESQLKSGAFFLPKSDIKRFFAVKWDKDKDMKMPAESSDIILLALKKVNVFFYAGHGDGFSLECVKFDFDNENNTFTRTYVDSYKISQGLGKLQLVVIGSCRNLAAAHYNFFAQENPNTLIPQWNKGFSLVQELVNKGAKFGIGVGGAAHLDDRPPYNPHNPKLYYDWYFLYTNDLQFWSEFFWALATKSEKLKMAEAAAAAQTLANLLIYFLDAPFHYWIVEENNEQKKYYDDRFVRIYLFGQNDYLGHFIP